MWLMACREGQDTEMNRPTLAFPTRHGRQAGQGHKKSPTRRLAVQVNLYLAIVS